MNRKLLLLCTTCVLPGVLAAQEQPKPKRAEPRSSIMTYSFSGSHARIGVVVATAANADSDKIGARIAAVTPGGPAAKAGLQAGDVITKFNNVSLSNVRSEDSDESGPGNKLRELAQALDPGDTAQVEYRRGSDTKKASIVAEDLTYSVNGNFPGMGDRSFSLTMPNMDIPRLEFDKQPMMMFGDGQGWGNGMGMGFCFGDAWCNLELVSLNSDLGDYFGTHDGVLVVKASEDSLLPLKSGDVIVAIGDRKPTSPAQAMRILRSYDAGETVNIEIMRHQKRQTVSWKVPSPEERERRSRDRVRTNSKMRTEEGARLERLMRPLMTRVRGVGLTVI